MRTLSSMSVLGALATAVACGGDSTAPSGAVAIGGDWTFAGASANTQLSETCSTNAVIHIVQTGSSFTGSVTSGNEVCSRGGADVNIALAGATLTAGQVSGSDVSFADSTPCTYSGAAVGNPAARILGTESCTVVASGVTFTLTGTWQATR
jgi:hypothetical protein